MKPIDTNGAAAMARNTASASTPSRKLGIAVLLGVLLAIPLFSVYMLLYDRQLQSASAQTEIAAGWGNAQTLSGPFLLIPYTHVVQAALSCGQSAPQSQVREEMLVLAPTQANIDTRLNPELRKVSIYEVVLYNAQVHAQGSFTLPDFAKLDIDPREVHLDRTQIVMGIHSAKGLAGERPVVTVDGAPLPLIPGSGLSQYSGNGFSGRLAAAPVADRPIAFDIRFDLRGRDRIAIEPAAQDTTWRVSSPWPNPSFVGGGFLPTSRSVTPQGFEAVWQIGNLALSRPIVSVGERNSIDEADIGVSLINTVNIYSEVSRAVKYGFLFIGFTFLALLLFDILLGVSVPGPAYLLVGVGLILFFVLLLAFAEVIGFTPAYLIASGAIVALLACYAAAILKSRRRAAILAVMLAALYGVLYVLLSLEAWSLLIGSLLVFAALAAVMYFTRKVNWRRIQEPPAAALGT